MPPVGRVDITAADAVGTAPITSVELSDTGGDPTADDLHDIAAMALANDAYVRSITTDLGTDKVNIAGDTMTDALEITVSSANTPALDVTGNGTGAGIVSTGGATGMGGVFEAGGGNNPGLTSTGAGTGAGATLTGGTTGPGLTAVNGTAQTNTTPTCAAQFAGYVQLTGTDPNAGVDPGANNAIHGASTTKARGRLVVSGSPPYTFADNYNFATTSTVPGAGTHRVTMIRAMADTNYSVFVNVHGDVGYSASETNIAGRTTSAFEVTVFATDTLTPGVGTITHIDFRVEGRQ